MIACLRRALVALIAAPVLAGCTNPTQAFDARMEQFVGKPEVFVIEQLGVPTRSTEAGGTRFIEYERRRLVSTPGLGGPAAWRWGAPLAGEVVSTRTCRVTFALQDGVVRRFERRGDDCVLMQGDPL